MMYVGVAVMLESGSLMIGRGGEDNWTTWYPEFSGRVMNWMGM